MTDLEWLTGNLVLWLILIFYVRDSSCTSMEDKLIEELFKEKKYQKLSRPSRNDREPVNISFSISISHISEVDVKHGLLKTYQWLTYVWNDYRLAWDNPYYKDIEELILPSSMIWIPDIILYNSGSDDSSDVIMPNAVVSKDGNILWVPPRQLTSTCQINIHWFPFDSQACLLKFGSWTYHGDALDIIVTENHSVTLDDFNKDGEWKLSGVTTTRSKRLYACCPHPYVDVTFTLHLSRRSFYYCFNLVIPCAISTALMLLNFVLPPDSGEKTGLAITILLSLSVFQLIVADMVPATSFTIPLISSYFTGSMIMCSLSVIVTIIVRNFHYRSIDETPLPRWVIKFIFNWLAPLLCISNTKNNMAITEETISNNGTPDEVIYNIDRVKFSAKISHDNLEQNSNGSVSDSGIILTKILQRHDEYNGFDENKLPLNKPGSSADNNNLAMNYQSEECPSERVLLEKIHDELKIITLNIKDANSHEEICKEWKLLAVVIDRICLCLFTVALVILTIAIFLSPPDQVNIDPIEARRNGIIYTVIEK